MSSDNGRRSSGTQLKLMKVAAAIAAFALVLVVHAALPGIAMPTLGQAIWTTSFSQSFANAGMMAIHAHGIGYPQTAAISLGLAGALPCAWLIDLGFSPADAYSGMVAIWLGVAFSGAMVLSRRYGATAYMAALLAALWLCTPMVWAHVDYSMVSLGMALLPTYTWSTLRSFSVVDKRGALLLILAALVAAFMDGYTFVMFAFVSGVLCMAALISPKQPGVRRLLLSRAIPLHVLAFGIALVGYRAYVHGGDYTPAPLEMFRAWGMDITFAAWPTFGEFWLWDALHLGSERTGRLFYGDASVWATTFGAPLLLVAGYAAWRRRREAMTVTWLVVALLAFFLSLGPSLKVDSRKPPGSVDVLMPAAAAVSPTGSAVLSEHVPGFRLMRATYRWAALGYLACWMLVVIALSDRRFGRAGVAYAIAGLMLLAFMPHPLRNLRDGVVYRQMAASIETDWIGALRNANLGPVVAFDPYGNDFLAAYTASRLNISTFNIGGDKNLEQAMEHWPAEMSALGDPGQPASAASIEAFLLKTGDQVVIPYVDLLQSAHYWPCSPVDALDASTTHRSGPVSSACVENLRARYAPTIESLRLSPFVEVEDGPLFAIVRAFKAADKPTYPIVASRDGGHVLTDGWYGREAAFRWSGPAATLALPVPPECRVSLCSAVLSFDVFAASKSRHVDVIVQTLDEPAWETSVVADGSTSTLSLTLPLEGSNGIRRFEIKVPQAMSPSQLSGVQDARKLGIALRRIDLRIASRVTH